MSGPPTPIQDFDGSPDVFLAKGNIQVKGKIA